MDHHIRDFPNLQARELSSTSSGPGQQKKPRPAGRARVPARVYALDKNNVESEAEVVEAKLSISGKLAKVLIDPGSTHSFARPKFMKGLGSTSEILPYLVEVSTPTGGQAIETDKICRKCEVKIKDRIFPADLISLPIHGYDVKLGMDWLAQYYVQLNCRTNEVSLCLPGEPVLKLNFKKSQEPLGFVSGKKARKLFWK